MALYNNFIDGSAKVKMFFMEFKTGLNLGET